jgi:hypothetical protein
MLCASLSCGVVRAELDPDRLAEAIATLQIAESDWTCPGKVERFPEN